MLLNETLPYCRGDHYAKRYVHYDRPGVIYRDQTSDKREFAEAMALMDARHFAGHKIVEVGAGVGCFSALAIHRGAATALAIEPEECRHKVLLRQAKDRPEIRPLRAAIGPTNERRSMRWMVEGCATTQHDIAHMTMSSLHYVKPTLVKMSCGEGLPPIDRFPPTTRVVIAKCRHLDDRVMIKMRALLPHFKLTNNAIQSPYSARVWYIWEVG